MHAKVKLFAWQSLYFVPNFWKYSLVLSAHTHNIIGDRLKEHIAEQQNNPILIFPEGEINFI